MPIYKIKEQIMKNLLFTFPKHIFTKHLYITYHIYRYKQYITNIKILRILITITTTAMMLVVNNNDNINNNNNNNNNNNKIIITTITATKNKIRKGKKPKLRRLPHTLTR